MHALVGDPLGAQVLDRLVAVQEELARRSWSATIRLTSSGIVRSKLRRPDSMWATGICILTAVSAAARVELTSPGTITRSGCSLDQDRLQPLHRPRRLLRVAAGADLEHVVGRRHAELLEEDLRHQPVVVLAGVDDRVATLGQARAQGADHRRRLDEVGPGPDHVDDPHRGASVPAPEPQAHSVARRRGLLQ